MVPIDMVQIFCVSYLQMMEFDYFILVTNNTSCFTENLNSPPRFKSLDSTVDQRKFLSYFTVFYIHLSSQ